MMDDDELSAMTFEQLKETFLKAQSKIKVQQRVNSKRHLITQAIRDRSGSSQAEQDAFDALMVKVDAWIEQKAFTFSGDIMGRFEASIDLIIGFIANDLQISTHNLLYVYRKYSPAEPLDDSENSDNGFADNFYEAIVRAHDENLITVPVLDLARPEIMGARLLKWLEKK